MRFEDQRKLLVQELRQQGIRDEAVLAAFSKVPRELYVPPQYKDYAYRNRPLPIGLEQTISQPLMVAIMLEHLELKPEDLVQLCRIGLDHPDIHFEVLYGASYNERAWWDNHRAYDLGYRPTGRAEDFREHAMAEQAKLPPDPVSDFYQGGAFCGMEFDGDKSRIIDWK